MVEADTRFTDEPEPGQRTEERIKPRTVGIILLLTALFAPIAASFSTSMWEGFYLSILSLPFIINYSPREGFYFYPTMYLPWGVPDIYYLMNISMLLAVYGGPRLVFLYQMVRLYKGRTTKKRTVLLGLITDCYFLFVMFPSLISMLLYPSSYFYMVLPIPIALLVALILMKIRPPSQVITPWKELDEPDKWWDKRAAPTVPPPTRKQPPDVQVDEKKDSTTKEGPWWEEEKKDKKPSEEPTSPW